MRRILLLATVVVMLAAMLAVTAGAASATIHRVSCADENANEDQASSTAWDANPPGITTSDDPDPDNVPQSLPALIVDEDRDQLNSGGTLTPEKHKDFAGKDDNIEPSGTDGPANADKPGCVPPGQ